MSATGRNDQAGFTLLEMLVVMAVTGLIAGLSFPVLERALAAQELSRAVAAAGTELAMARARAIASGEVVRFVPSAALRRRLRMTGPQGAQGEVIFHADGSSNGAVLVIAPGAGGSWASGASANGNASGNGNRGERGPAGTRLMVERATGAIGTLR